MFMPMQLIAHHCKSNSKTSNTLVTTMDYNRMAMAMRKKHGIHHLETEIKHIKSQHENETIHK